MDHLTFKNSIAAMIAVIIQLPVSTSCGRLSLLGLPIGGDREEEVEEGGSDDSVTEESSEPPPGFFDDFTSLETSRWTEVKSGTASISQSSSTLTIDSGDSAGLIYLNEKVDLTKRNQFWVAADFTDADAGTWSAIYLYDGIPSVGSTADQSILVEVQKQDSNRWQARYFSAGHTQNHWRGTSQDWSTSFEVTHSRRQSNDLYTLVIETRPNGGSPQFRILIAHKMDTSGNGFTGPQGYRMYTVTTWVGFSTLQANSGDIYFAIGDPDSDQSGSAKIEWVAHNQLDSDDLPDSSYTFVNRSHDMTFPPPYDIALYYTLGDSADRRWYVPIDKDPDVLTRGAGGSVDEIWASRPSVVKDGSTYYLVYDCRNSAGLVQICGATSSDPEGPWTKVGVLIADAGANDDWRFAWIDKDDSEASSWKIWLANEAGTTGVYLSESSAFASGWSVPTLKIASSGVGGEWNESFVSQPVWWNDATSPELWVAGGKPDALVTSLWQSGCYKPDSSNRYNASFTACAANPIIQAGSGTMSSGASSGHTITLDDTSTFRAGQWLSFRTPNSPFYSRVKSIDSSTTLTLWHGISNLADAIHVRAMDGFSSAVRSLRQEDEKIRLYVTAFKFSGGEESTYVLETSDSTPSSASWQGVDQPWGIPIALEGDGIGESIENMAFIRAPLN